MKFGVVEHNGAGVLAMNLGPRWVDLTAAHADYARVVDGREAAAPQSVLDLIAAGCFHRSYCRRMAEFVQRHGRLGDYTLPVGLRFRAPLRPGKIIAIGRNYRAHAEELGNTVPEEPLFFCKSPTAVIGMDDAIVVKGWYGRVDFEGELAVVIGKAGKEIAEEAALEHIAGYTLLNDVTAREMQNADKKKGHPWFRSKNLDTFCPMGPVVLMAAAVEYPLALEIETTVNGERRQAGNTRDFVFPLERLISYVSRFMTLEAGDVIATGTPEGVGPLVAGDVVEVHSEAIGALRNPVAAG